MQVSTLEEHLRDSQGACEEVSRRAHKTETQVAELLKSDASAAPDRKAALETLEDRARQVISTP